MIKPLQDRLLIRRITEPDPLIKLVHHGDSNCIDATGGDYRRNAVLAEVIAVGPGKWIEGEWWSVLQKNGKRDWEWFPGYRRAVTYRPKQRIYCTSWNDLDGYLPKDQALIMEGDILGLAHSH